jgi:error-prone DNA polymerase
MPYTPLWCKSCFSFLEGASQPEELVDAIHQLRLRAFALSDRDGLYGAPRAHLAARELGVHLIVGAQLTLEDATTIVLLAQDRRGYANLSRLITAGRLRSQKGTCCVTWEEVYAHAIGLIALWGGEPSLLGGTDDPAARAAGLRDAFGDRAYALAARHRRDAETRQEARLRARARRFGFPIVAAHEVLYHDRARRPLQDVLTCIRHGVTLGEIGTRIKPNAEYALKTPEDFAALFGDDPDAVLRTREVAERCTFSLAELRYRFPLDGRPGSLGTSERLAQLTWEGARLRYSGRVPPDVTAQIERELTLIREMDYGGYFMTVHDLVEVCRQRGILCQGRGSAANSAVCYCLGITAVDPVRMELLFERFISRERAEPPDIDLDVQHDRREEVIQYLYDAYGRSHAAMVANVIRYRPKSAVRDVGKALGIPLTTVERIAKILPFESAVPPDVLRQAGLEPDGPAHRHLVRLANEILDIPRHLSIHPGGFLLGQDPVSEIVPIENATMPGRTVIQWDKDDLEILGLFKVDVLGLGGLTLLDRGLELVRRHRGLELRLDTIPPEDPATFAMIQRADTIGTFQIESRAQMAMLPRLRPRTWYDLVVQVAIIRPGPITGGMVHPFLRRRNGEEAVEYPHPSLEPVLRKTLGVPLFQEQVMRIAMAVGDYTPGEADQLRRDMAAWRRQGKMARHRERLVAAMCRKGIPLEFAENVFRQIEGFGEYGFPESHAASFALIAYATAYLKCHYPAEFACALLNAQPMGFYAPATIVDDAKRHGVAVRPVDITQSDWDCTLEPDGESTRGLALRMGLRYVLGLGKKDWEKIVTVRQASPFGSEADVAARTGLDAGMLQALAEAGALETFGRNRRQGLWAVRGVPKRDGLDLGHIESVPEFLDLARREEISWDYRTTNHSPRGHPLEAVREALRAQGLLEARAVARLPHGRRIRYAGLVICRQSPATASGVTFMTLEDETGFVNVVLWKNIFDAFPALAKAAPFLGVTGRVQSEGNVVHLVAEALWKPKLAPELQGTQSRDFR